VTPDYDCGEDCEHELAMTATHSGEFSTSFQKLISRISIGVYTIAGL
jgi:hypothetical protein